MIGTGDGIVTYRQRMPLALRLFAGVLGIGLATAIPTPFLMHMRWTTPPLSLLVAGVAILASVALGLFFLFLALVPASDLRIDARRGVVEMVSRGPLGRRERRWPLTDLAMPEVFERDSEDGRYPVLRIRLPGWPRRIDIVPDTMAEAKALRAQIAAMIAAARG